MKFRFFEPNQRKQSDISRLTPLRDSGRSSFLSSSDPFQSEYFNRNLFDINMKKMISSKFEDKTLNAVVTLKSGEMDFSRKEDIVSDFKKFFGSVCSDVANVQMPTGQKEETQFSKKELKVIRESIGIFFGFIICLFTVDLKFVLFMYGQN